ncbi:J domain-containing protein, partial [Haematococcus lacustris]
MVVSFYEQLGVPESADLEQVRAAFRAAALRLHPDKSYGAAADEFVSLNKAWQVLRDPHLRKIHDQQLALHRIREPAVFQDEVTLDDMELTAVE